MDIIGVVADTFGLNGDLKIKLLDKAFVSFFEVGKTVFINIAGTDVEFKVDHFRQLKELIVDVHFEKIDKIYLAEFVLGLGIYTNSEVERSELFFDIEKYRVEIDNKEYKIKSILISGDNEVLECVNGEKSILVPFVDQFIDFIDGDLIKTKNLEGMDEI